MDSSPHSEESKIKETDADLETASIGEGHSKSKFSRLGWQKLTICLIVEAIALGALSIPSAFAALGMVAGVILSIGLGLIAIYTSYVVGQVKMIHPDVKHYADFAEHEGLELVR